MFNMEEDKKMSTEAEIINSKVLKQVEEAEGLDGDSCYTKKTLI